MLQVLFKSSHYTWLLVLPVINTGLESPTVPRLPYCLFCPALNNELDPPMSLASCEAGTHTHHWQWLQYEQPKSYTVDLKYLKYGENHFCPC